MKIGSFDIAANSLYAEMQSLSTHARNNITPEVKPDQGVAKSSTTDFGELFQKALSNVNDLGHESKAKVTAFEMGDKSVSIADAMIAKEKSGVAFEATLQVRNKVLEAYQKIMQMPV